MHQTSALAIEHSTPIPVSYVSHGVMVLAGCLYAASIHLALVVYLQPVWEYYGFTYVQPDFDRLGLMFILIGAVSWAVPTTIAGASNIVLVVLYIAVYVPTIVVSLCLGENSITKYGSSLAALAISFLIACYFGAARESARPSSGNLLTARLEAILFLAWAVLGVILIAKYHSIMSFVNLDEVYTQRSLATGEATVWSGYAQAYFSVVLSPVLLTVGLIRRRIVWIASGILGFVIMYMIAAQRTIILLPLVIIGMFFMLQSRRTILRSTAFFLALLSVLVIWAVLNHHTNQYASFLARFLVFRTLGLPGLMFSQYSDLFSAEGFTWWSHVKGINLLVSPPPTLADHPSWPGLGYIAGDFIYNKVTNNHNANLFAGDGVAAAGSLGVLLIGGALAVWLKLLRRYSVRWDCTLATLLLVPLAVHLTNSHFFTTLLSYGGIFWVLIFRFCAAEQKTDGSRL
jgi:hypothetical protein